MKLFLSAVLLASATNIVLASWTAYIECLDTKAAETCQYTLGMVLGSDAVYELTRYIHLDNVKANDLSSCEIAAKEHLKACGGSCPNLFCQQKESEFEIKYTTPPKESLPLPPPPMVF